MRSIEAPSLRSAAVSRLLNRSIAWKPQLRLAQPVT